LNDFQVTSYAVLIKCQKVSCPTLDSCYNNWDTSLSGKVGHWRADHASFSLADAGWHIAYRPTVGYVLNCRNLGRTECKSSY